jgi:hypothetical protein
MLNTTIKIFVIAINLVFLFLSLSISPYRDELDLDEKQISDNGVLILRSIYILIVVFSLLFFARFRTFKSVPSSIVLLMALFSFVKLLTTFFL